MHTDEVVKAYRCIPAMCRSIVCNLSSKLFGDIRLFIEVHSDLPAYSVKIHLGCTIGNVGRRPSECVMPCHARRETDAECVP